MFWGETARNHLGYVIENILHAHPLSTGYHGSDCTCIHSPPLSFFYTPFLKLLWQGPLWPKVTNLLTHSCYRVCSLFFLSVLLLYSLSPVLFFFFFFLISSIKFSIDKLRQPRGVNIRSLLNNEPRVFVEEQRHLVDTGSFPPRDMFCHSTPLCSYGFTVTHPGQRGCLSVLLIFSLAPLLVW